MYTLLKSFGILLFVLTPVSFVAAIYYGEWRFVWIGLVLFLFFAMADGLANNLNKSFKGRKDSKTTPKSIEESEIQWRLLQWYLMADSESIDYGWEDDNEERLWYCEHNRAYGICRKCELSDD